MRGELNCPKLKLLGTTSMGAVCGTAPPTSSGLGSRPPSRASAAPASRGRHLHVRLMAEASLPSLRHERAAPCLGAPRSANSGHALSKIDRFPGGHAECGRGLKGGSSAAIGGRLSSMTGADGVYPGVRPEGSGMSRCRSPTRSGIMSSRSPGS
jgi:hypothetical protein